MPFDHAIFWLFLPITLAIFYRLPPRWRAMQLVIASYVFYGWWDPRFLTLILASTCIDYWAGLRMPSLEGRPRKRLLLVSLVANLGFLGFFKYYDFFAASLASALGMPADSWTLKVILPVGISFYTFQSMSYTIDVYRGELRPERSFVKFALFVSFFPQLVAGPIVRARDFFPQLDRWQAPTPGAVQRGLVLIGIGLVKKMVFADHFALISDQYFSAMGSHPGALPAWEGLLAFSLQIFFDFSGYTDIARGCAKLLGFHFPINFRRPYLAKSITEFWRRWHISLSSWLRDYLYIPLGGNRGSALFTYRNLMLTMLLGGLWHGASWNFVLWGGYHGALLGLHRALPLDQLPAFAQRLRTPFTFVLVILGWVPFRARGFEDSASMLGQLFGGGSGEALMSTEHHVLLLLALVGAILEEKYGWSTRIVRGSMALRVAFFAGTLLVLEIFAVTETVVPFVYFRF